MTQLIFDFGNDRDIAVWMPVNDVIMGGMSDGRLEPTGTGTAAFAGVVSLEQGGGFASVRSRPQSRDLSGYSSLELRVRGDGRRYKINLKTDARANGILYTAQLEARADEWRTVRLAFEAFRPTFRGRVSPDAEPLDLSRVVSFGLMISDRQAGPFRLEIATIGVRADIL